MVIDASVAASWYLKSQASASATALYRQAETESFVAPIYFGVEMRNVLLLGERRGALEPSQMEAILVKLGLLVDCDVGDIVDEAERAVPIARQTGLKLYDSIYLEKAMREGRPLASRDRQLIEAAVAVGVDVYDARL